MVNMFGPLLWCYWLWIQKLGLNFKKQKNIDVTIHFVVAICYDSIITYLWYLWLQSTKYMKMCIVLCLSVRVAYSVSSQSIIYRCSFSYYSVTYIPTKSNCTDTTTLHCRKVWQECEYSTPCIIAFIFWLLLALIILRCFLNFCATQVSLWLILSVVICSILTENNIDWIPNNWLDLPNLEYM